MILVTGATGFIGSRLTARLLEQGRPFRCLVRSLDRARRAGVPERSAVTGDLLDPPSLPAVLKDASVVIHLAGVVRALHPGGFQEGNRTATAHLVAALREGGGRLVHVSSLAATGPTFQGGESAGPAGSGSPVSAYGVSKQAAEREVAGAGTAFPWVILRPPVVYGPGDLDLLPVFRMAARGFLPHPSPGWPCSLLFVEDLVSALLLAADSALEGAALPVTCDPPLDPGGLAACLAGALGRPVRPLGLPPALVLLAGLLTEGASGLLRRPATFGRGKAREMTAGPWVADPAPVRKLLGFEAAHPAGEAFARTAAWYRARGLLRGGGSRG